MFNTFIIFLYMFRALLLCSPFLSSVLNSHLKRLTIPDDVLIQFELLKMSIIVLERNEVKNSQYYSSSGIEIWK